MGNGVAVMAGQMDIFSFIESLSKDTDMFSWDEDINEIVEKLDAVAKKNELNVSKKQWSVWGHVPQFGYRLIYTIEVHRQESEEFQKELMDIVEFAKERDVELSVYEPHFFEDEIVSSMYIFSTFLDKKRQKRKNW